MKVIQLFSKEQQEYKARVDKIVESLKSCVELSLIAWV